MVLGADRPVSREELGALFSAEHVPVGLIVGVHGADDGGIALVHEHAHLSALAQIHGQAVLMEAVQVQSLAAVHQAQQQVLVDDLAGGGHGLLEVGAADADALDQALRLDGLVVHVDQLELQGRGTGVDDQNFHRVLPPS